MNSSTISTRINVNTLEKLEKLSKSTKRSKSYLAAEAIQLYVDEQSWQIDAINEGIKQADAGDFASENEVKDTFKKWGVNGD